jgi:hypothetical protein
VVVPGKGEISRSDQVVGQAVGTRNTIHEVRFGLWQNNLSAEPTETAFEEAGRIATDEVGFDPGVAVAARGRYLRAELLVTTTIPVAVTW